MRITLIYVASALTCGCAPQSPVEGAYDKRFVDRAIEIYSGGKMTRSEVLSDVNPAVVYLPDMVCVGMNLPPNVVGGGTTYCFDKVTLKLKLKYEHGS